MPHTIRSESDPEPRAPRKSTFTGIVVLYSSADCPDCDRARAWLREHGISFEERDINDPVARDDRARLGVHTVPAVNVDGQPVLGFDPEVLRSLLIEQRPDHVPQHIKEKAHDDQL